MYNKLFTKILDSSIWLESTATRLVWMTLLACMDEDGFCQFASVPNLAYRARVTQEEAQVAIDCLEGPDPNSSDPDFEGRRIERVPGGWMVLNAVKYKELVTREIAKEKNRQRVAKHRETKRGNGAVTACNADVMPSNDSVMQSETDTESDIETKTEGWRDFLSAWNDLPDPVPKIRQFGESRKSHFKARMKDRFWREGWREALAMIPTSAFLTGDNDRKWIISSDWFLQPESVTKILEGKYGARPKEGGRYFDSPVEQLTPADNIRRAIEAGELDLMEQVP